MKYITGKHIVFGWLAAALVLLTGCQSDGADTTPRQNPTMEMQAYATSYIDAMPAASTRAGEWWLPTDMFELYSGHDAIKVAFTQGSSIAKSYDTDHVTDDDAAGSFVFVPGKTPTPDKWMSSFKLPTTGGYYLYGFMSNKGDLGLSPASGGYAVGATMTITGLPTATSSDVCAIVGVKKGVVTGKNSDGSDIVSINNVKMGQFGYTIDGETNHVYLLCDHLYAALQLNIKVNETYNALRHIKLKKVWVKDCKNGEGKTFTSKSNVEISLLSNNSGASPIQGDIAFENVGSSETNMEQDPLYKSELTGGLPLTTSYQEVQGYMAPIGMTEFTLVCQYDVYDTNVTTDHPDGNLIRENQTAENKIIIKNLFTATTSLVRGTRYILKLTVNPTYLYMMSEPDLDNPTVEIVSNGD